MFYSSEECLNLCSSQNIDIWVLTDWKITLNYMTNEKMLFIKT